MDIFTGEVIAMHSSPSFDPNSFVFGISKDEWQLIRNNPMKPLINKTLSGNYSPGSTIKPIVALSALENNIVSPKFTVNCKGHKHPLELYGQKYHCWKKEGHGFVNLREAMKQSCDTYFYEVARKLGVDRLSETAKKFGLGKKVFNNLFENEKNGLIPNTFWKKEILGKNWLLGETIITGIGQGYIQTTPIQLCLMTAQIANGGYKIKPHIIHDESINYNDIRARITRDIESNYLSLKKEGSLIKKNMLKEQEVRPYERMYQNQENIKFVLEAMFASTNEQYGTSFKSRHKNPKYQFAGKTGTSQVRRITEAERKLDLDQSQIEYKSRDHASYIAFAPYKDPRYAISVLVEHGGSGSSAAAPRASKLIKKIIDRHELRESTKKEIRI